ncbi:MAG: Uma2 family endonuclease [Candidatus Riflebacteria bacterium]|nr:Uma2 family endonuclease [Candidatus Riflebacteria bacterium]
MAGTVTRRRRRHSIEEYDALPEGEWCEFIDGQMFDMVAAPGSAHQAVAMDLGRQFANFLLGKPCQVFPAPYEVRLPEARPGRKKDFTVVLPDLVVVCDPARRTPRGCLGAPDLVVEILSPATVSHDQVRKLNLYERHGVREYWIVHPEGTVMVFHLGPDARYGRPRTFARDQQVPVGVLEGCSIDLTTVFPGPATEAPAPGSRRGGVPAVREPAAPYRRKPAPRRG